MIQLFINNKTNFCNKTKTITDKPREIDKMKTKETHFYVRLASLSDEK